MHSQTISQNILEQVFSKFQQKIFFQANSYANKAYKNKPYKTIEGKLFY